VNDAESDGIGVAQAEETEESLNAKRSAVRNGLTRRQRIFLLEKLVGLSGKDAALAAGYSLSVSENTKQRMGASLKRRCQPPPLRRRGALIGNLNPSFRLSDLPGL
jgi:hypothetical protein